MLKGITFRKNISKKLKKIITIYFIICFNIGSGFAMETQIFSEEASLRLLSSSISPDTQELFSSFCVGEELDTRITNFLSLNEGFILTEELTHFYEVLETYEIQKSLLESMNSKKQPNPFENDEYIAYLLFSQDQNNQNDEAIAHALFNQKPISLQVQKKVLELESGTDGQKNTVSKFRDILNHLRAHEKTPNLDVHFFDNYIFGSQKKILDLIDFGNHLQVDQDGLSLAQIGLEMNQFIDIHPSNFTNFIYFTNQTVTPEVLKGHVTTHFSKMDSEVAVICPAAKIIWSKAWTLAKALYKQEDDVDAIHIIFEQVCENYLTQGGCIQGRINRGFVGYITLLTKCGIE